MRISSNKIVELAAIQQEDKQDNLLILMQHDIRWLSNYRANTRVMETYSSIIKLLNLFSKTRIIAQGLKIKMRIIKILLYYVN